MHDNDNITYLLNLELFRPEEVGDITMALSSISLAPRPNRFGLADTEGEARIAVFGEQGGGELHGELENDHLERYYYSTRHTYLVRIGACVCVTACACVVCSLFARPNSSFCIV